MGVSRRSPSHPHATRAKSVPVRGREKEKVAERQRALAELAHQDGSEAGDTAADDLLDAGALRLDALEPAETSRFERCPTAAASPY